MWGPRHVTRHIHWPSWRGHKCASIRHGLTRPQHALALCLALCGTDGAPETVRIGPCVLGGKLGQVTSKGAAVLVLVRSSCLDVEARGGTCTQVINVVHSGTGITLSMVGA